MQQSLIFTGSSIISLWEDLPAEVAGLPTLNTAVSGSQTAGLLRQLDELVIRHKARAVCYYCGSNDLNSAVPITVICANVLRSFELILRSQPEARLIYLSIIKAPQKQDRLNQVDLINHFLRACADQTGCFTFIDINPVFFNADGSPRLEFFLEDLLHLTPTAYSALNAHLVPRLERLLAGG